MAPSDNEGEEAPGGNDKGTEAFGENERAEAPW